MPKTKNNEPEIIASAKYYMGDNFKTIKSVKEIAKYTDCSYQKLRKLFSLREDRTLISYLNMVRSIKAIDLLRTTDWTLDKIAFEVGIRDKGYLIKIIKIYFKKIPSKIRKPI